MISPSAFTVGKIGTGIIVLTAVEIAAYEISPETFSLVAVGMGALAVAVTGMIGLLLSHLNNKKNREQLAQIAHDQATALSLQSETSTRMQTLEVRMDGRMDKLLSQTAEIAEEVGVKKGLQQAADTAAIKSATTMARDDKIVDKVAGAVVDRIGEAADAAAQTVPVKQS